MFWSIFETNLGMASLFTSYEELEGKTVRETKREREGEKSVKHYQYEHKNGDTLYSWLGGQINVENTETEKTKTHSFCICIF